MRIALDTNILVYAMGINGVQWQNAALELIDKVDKARTFIPIQVLGELFNVLIRKAGRSSRNARETIIKWHDAFPCIDTTSKVLETALDLAADHQLPIWDAVVFSAAAQADCRLLISEDLAEGFTWNGVTVVNPFATNPHPLLAQILMSE